MCMLQLKDAKFQGDGFIFKPFLLEYHLIGTNASVSIRCRSGHSWEVLSTLKPSSGMFAQRTVKEFCFSESVCCWVQTCEEIFQKHFLTKKLQPIEK